MGSPISQSRTSPREGAAWPGSQREPQAGGPDPVHTGSFSPEASASEEQLMLWMWEAKYMCLGHRDNSQKPSRDQLRKQKIQRSSR